MINTDPSYLLPADLLSRSHLEAEGKRTWEIQSGDESGSWGRGHHREWFGNGAEHVEDTQQIEIKQKAVRSCIFASIIYYAHVKGQVQCLIHRIFFHPQNNLK